jgi:hypothetical protein
MFEIINFFISKILVFSDSLVNTAVRIFGWNKPEFVLVSYI